MKEAWTLEMILAINLKLEFNLKMKNYLVSSVIGDMAKLIIWMDSRGLRRINESLAKVCCKQSVSTRWASKLLG